MDATAKVVALDAVALALIVAAVVNQLRLTRLAKRAGEQIGVHITLAATLTACAACQSWFLWQDIFSPPWR